MPYLKVVAVKSGMISAFYLLVHYYIICLNSINGKQELFLVKYDVASEVFECRFTRKARLDIPILVEAVAT